RAGAEKPGLPISNRATQFILRNILRAGDLRRQEFPPWKDRSRRGAQHSPGAQPKWLTRRSGTGHADGTLRTRLRIALLRVRRSLALVGVPGHPLSVFRKGSFAWSPSSLSERPWPASRPPGPHVVSDSPDGW